MYLSSRMHYSKSTNTQNNIFAFNRVMGKKYIHARFQENFPHLWIASTGKFVLFLNVVLIYFINILKVPDYETFIFVVLPSSCSQYFSEKFHPVFWLPLFPIWVPINPLLQLFWYLNLSFLIISWPQSLGVQQQHIKINPNTFSVPFPCCIL